MISELKRLKGRAEEKYALVHDEKQKQQLQLEIKIPGNLLEYVRIYYNEKIDESIHALSIETVGPVSSTAPLAEHMEETIDKVLQQ
ncbi:unnamed protein product [Adineta steineri]|uniref:Uncharacterized protein n=1 Tax=Adineta steineri TaxID=433720 RepID=A0A818N6K4_9BILA|nr:unnamed protein product [Adineta steineri]CAF3600054.1 unnamed protein product [Adineta steineri]